MDYYLGFIISDKGIQPEPEKVRVIKALLQPTCVRNVRSFVGMTGYYRRVIAHYSQIAEPQIELTRKYVKFKWTELCAVKILKVIYLLYHFLHTPTRTNVINTLYTNASQSAIGACLTQPCDEPFDNPNIRNEKPLFFLSHKHSDTETRWSVVEKRSICDLLRIAETRCLPTWSLFYHPHRS